MSKVPDTKEYLQQCICEGCPSYNQCMKDNSEVLYCARARSACEFEKNGCMCLACPLTSEFNLEKLYYCEIGASE
jgi:hypothetical protein